MPPPYFPSFGVPAWAQVLIAVLGVAGTIWGGWTALRGKRIETAASTAAGTDQWVRQKFQEMFEARLAGLDNRVKELETQVAHLAAENLRIQTDRDDCYRRLGVCSAACARYRQQRDQSREANGVLYDENEQLRGQVAALTLQLTTPPPAPPPPPGNPA